MMFGVSVWVFGSNLAERRLIHILLDLPWTLLENVQ